jgi:dihydrofolate synthase/folylpolyglutamate synthase
MCYREGATRLDLPAPALGGPHQIDNAGIAIACAKRLAGFDLDDDAIARGLTGVVWPARLQRLERGPLPASLPAGWELWLDGGHNEAAGEALAETARQWSDRPLDLVFGMLGNKDLVAFLRPIAPSVRASASVSIPGEESSLTAADAAAAARAAYLRTKPADELDDAIRALVAQADQPGRILICGSLYLAGVVLALNG